DGAVAEWIGEEELERTESPLLGEEAHGEQRNGEDQHQADVDEEDLPEVLHDVQAEAEGDEVDEVGVEVVAGVGEEGGGHQVNERRAEVGAQLLPEERDEALHALAPG